MDLLTPTIPLIRQFQSIEWLVEPMRFLSLLGNEEFFVLLLPLVYWLVSRRVGAQLGVLLLVSVVVNGLFKIAFGLPRPYWGGEVLSLSQETSFGFPSGHAQNAALLWTFLALQSSARRVFVPLALLLALLISLSRIYLGVHYPLDILGGWFLGFSLLALYLRFKAPLFAWWNGSLAARKIVLVAVLVFALWLPFSFFVGGAIETDASPQTQARIAALASKVANLGAVLGLFVGLSLVPKWETQCGPTIKIARFLVGFAGLALIYIGLKKVLPESDVFRFGRYFLTTFWVTYGAPMLFLRTRLASLEVKKAI